MSRLHLTTILIFSLFILTTSRVEAFTISKPSMNNLGLVGHWTFDGKDTVWTSSTAGTVTDASGNGNTGTLTNMNSSSAPTVGKIGQALEFDGSSSCVNGGNNSMLNITDALTLSVWVNPNSSALNRAILAKSAVGGGASSQQYHFMDAGSNAVRFVVMNASTQALTRSTGSNTMPNNTWTHLVGIYNGIDTVYLYINGELSGQITSAEFGALNESGKNVLIGATHGSSVCNGGYFDGKIDDARIYNRALSAQEVKALYTTGTSRFSASKAKVTNGLVGHWTMDGKDTVWTSSTEATVSDASGNGNTGTLLSMSASTALVAGRSGQALWFDGNDDRVSLGDMSAIENVSEATFAFWVKPETLKTSAIYMAKYNNNNSSISFRISESNSGCGGDSDDVVMYLSSGICARTNLNFLSPGQWSHIVYVFDGSQSTNATKLKVYINGSNESLSFVGTIPTSLPDTGSNLVLGSYSNGGAHSHGAMDDVRVYNRALTVDEVSAIYRELSEQKINVAPTNLDSRLNFGLNYGLVGHWTFDGKDTVWTSSTEGTIRDASGNGNTGTLSNMSASSSPVMGKIGQGIRFDGVDDYITFGSNFIGTNPLTFCGWFNIDTVASGDVIVHNGETQLAFSTNSRFYFTSNNSNFPISATGALSANRWLYVCATRNESAITNLYVNGVQTGTANQNGSSVDVGSSVRFGSATNGAGDFAGIMDEIRIYTRVLSISEIKQLYNQVK